MSEKKHELPRGRWLDTAAQAEMRGIKPGTINNERSRNRVPYPIYNVTGSMWMADSEDVQDFLKKACMRNPFLKQGE